MISAAQRLRQLLRQPGPVIAVGAHSPLSALLAAEAGAQAIWASGFEISALQGVPDANLLTMAEQLEVAKRMARRVEIPVIADCDNGFGNAINVIRTVRDYEADGIAGVCLEDNVFPKRCSFYAGVKRELVSPEEHAGKIRAALAARRSADFVVIARTEAYIAGWGLDEARRRAELYADAGADMILVHSKNPDYSELQAFARGWERSTPLVAVPTIYSHVSADELAADGFKLSIFANHGLRASLRAMREVYRALLAGRKAEAAEPHVCALEEVYELVGVPQLRADEARFMPAGGAPVHAVILAAGASEELGELTADTHKSMLEVRGQTILGHQIAALNACGINEIAVVRGYQKDSVRAPGARTYDNERWESQGELQSLLCARNELQGRALVLYGDILFDPAIVQKLLQSQADVAVAVDRAWSEADQGGPKHPDLVVSASPPAEEGYRFVAGAEDELQRIGQRLDRAEANGEFAGIVSFSEAGLRRFLDACAAAAEADAGGPFHEAESFARASLTDLLQDLIERGTKVHAVSIYKGWSEVDTFEDYRKAWKRG